MKISNLVSSLLLASVARCHTFKDTQWTTLKATGTVKGAITSYSTDFAIAIMPVTTGTWTAKATDGAAQREAKSLMAAATATAAPESNLIDSTTQDVRDMKKRDHEEMHKFAERPYLVLDRRHAKNDPVNAVSCAKEGTLKMTLKDGILEDSKGRIGAIVSNRQFQFDGPPQAGTIYANGWEITKDGYLAIGKTEIFFRCLSGTFYNLGTEQNVLIKFTSVTEDKAARSSNETKTDNVRIKYDTEILSKLNSLTDHELNQKDVFGRNLVHYICIFGREDLLSRFLKKYLSRNRRDVYSGFDLLSVDYENWYTCLHFAVYLGNFNCVKVLLSSDLIDAKLRSQLLSSKDKDGMTPWDLLSIQTCTRLWKRIPECIGSSADDYNFNFTSVVATNRFSQTPSSLSAENWWSPFRGASELYVSGSNVNGCLGSGDLNDCAEPMQINNVSTNFRNKIKDIKKLTRFKSVAVSKSHTLVLTNEPKNNMYTTGSNKSGKLGLGTDSVLPQFSFKNVDLEAHIDKIAFSADHTIALDSQCNVYAWGSNSYNKLGKSLDTEFANSPVKISVARSDKLIGVACSSIHSVAYSKDIIQIWGLNIGQFGFQSAGEQILWNGALRHVEKTPVEFEFNHGTIKNVVCLDHCTLVLTAEDDLHAYINSFHSKLHIPKFMKQLENNDGVFDRLILNSLHKRLSVVKMVAKGEWLALLYDNGCIASLKIEESVKSKTAFQSLSFLLVWKPARTGLEAVDFDIADNGSVILATLDGTVYKRANSNGKYLKSIPVAGIYKAAQVSCDNCFRAFAYLKDPIDLVPVRVEKNTFVSSLFDLSFFGQLSSIQLNDMEDKVAMGHFSKSLEVVQKDEQTSWKHLGTSFHKSALDTFKSRYDGNDKLYKEYSRRWMDANNLKLLETLKYSPTTEDFRETEKLIDDVDSQDWRLRVGCYEVPIVLEVVAARCKVFQKLLKGGNNSKTQFEDLSLSYIGNKTFVLRGVDIVTSLMLLHLIYTGDLLINITPNKQIIRMAKLLEITNSLNQIVCDTAIEKLYKVWLEDDFLSRFMEGTLLFPDTSEKLLVSKQILSQRSEFFAKAFEWSSDGVIVMENVSKQNMLFIVKYLYGADPIVLFDDIKYEDSLGFLFEMVDLSDELLLTEFKNLVQFVSCDLISIENVSEVVALAYDTKCKRLFEQCCWFIFNNIVEFFSNDGRYCKYLDATVSRKIECYFKHFMRFGSFGEVSNDLKTYKQSHSKNLHSFMFKLRELNLQFMAEDACKFCDTQPNRSRKPSMERRASLKAKRSTSFANEQKPEMNVNDLLGFKGLDDFAIDDSDDDFTVVGTNRRRRQSSRHSLVQRLPDHEEISKMTAVKADSPKPVTKTPRVTSPKTQSAQHWPSLNDPIQKVETPKIGTSATLKMGNSKKVVISGSLDILDQEILKPKSSGNPWNVTSTSKSSKTPKKEEYPSLAEVHDESKIVAEKLEMELNKELKTESRTLEEIQEEEKFNKWFEEEAKRVQREIALSEKMSQTRQKSPPKGKSTRKSGNKGKEKLQANETSAGTSQKSIKSKGKSKGKDRDKESDKDRDRDRDRDRDKDRNRDKGKGKAKVKAKEKGKEKDSMPTSKIHFDNIKPFYPGQQIFN